VSRDALLMYDVIKLSILLVFCCELLLLKVQTI